MSSFSSLATALCPLFLRELDASASTQGESAALFICRTHDVQNPLVRAALAVLAWYFAYSPVLRYGAAFTRLSPDVQMRTVGKWRRSRVSFKRDFIQFFQNLAIQAYFDSDVSLQARPIDLSRYRALQRLYTLGTSYD